MPQNQQNDLSDLGAKPVVDLSDLGAKPVETKAKTKASPPGLIQRYAESFGIPTSVEGLIESTKEGLTSAAFPGYGIATSSLDYLKRAGQGVKETIKEGKEAGENIGRGQPVLPNVGKAAYAGLQGGLKAIPIVGQTIQTAGEDFAAKNYRGAAGGILGLTTQAALASKPFADRMASLGKKGPPLAEPHQISDIMGRSIQEQLINADEKMHAEVSAHAEHVAKTIDDPARNPVGVIDAKPVVQSLRSLWDTYIKTYTPALGAKPPAAFEGVVNEALKSPGNRWTWEQAKQIRSAISEIAVESKNPKVRAISAQLSKQLRGELRSQAQKVGLEKDFDAYNKLHENQQRLREQIIDPVKKSISGEDVMRILHGNLGYLENTLPSLDAYGAESKPIIDAAKISKDPKSRLWKGWAVRHAGAALASSVGAPYMAGYMGAGMVGEAMDPLSRQARGLSKTPQYSRGIQLLQESLPPKPQPLQTPTPIPPQLAPLPKRALPSLPKIRTAEVVTSPTPEPEPTPVRDKYAKTQERLAYTRTINSAINRLAKGVKKALTGAEIEWIEKETGLDMTDPANISKARKILMQKRTELTKGLPPVPQVGKK